MYHPLTLWVKETLKKKSDWTEREKSVLETRSNNFENLLWIY